ncbi:MAG: hypothetical protein IKN72_02450 [Clostridia bacterium]|nr:hypothetical protein [Clostridia bacterium]
MKRCLSVFLAVLMLLTSLSCLTAVAEDKVCNCEHMPMIYVFGKQHIYDDPHAENRRELDGLDAVWAKGLIGEGIKKFAKGLVTNNYDDFIEYVATNFEEKYAGFACQDNGDLPDNSTGIDYSWSPETMIDDHVWDNVYSYVYIYDARQDPMEIADDMHDYIESVRRVTGHHRVAVLSRCMGTEMALAYFAKYGWDDIDTFFSYSSAAMGTTIFSEIFAGKVELDLDSINEYYGTKYQYDTTEKKQLILTLLELISQLRALGLTEKALNRLFARLKTDLIPRILKASFATCPGYWTMVGPNDYEDAKAFLFKDDADKYADLIKRIDEYDRLVRQPMNELMLEMNKDVKMCILAKYGFQMIPATVSQREQSDDKITLKDQSFGATSAQIGKTLSTAYIEKAIAKGHGKYISPDRIVDASTALLPDQTWFVKNIRHNDFPGHFYDLVIRMIRADRQLTVNDDPEYPQYTVFYWEDGRDYWVPMTEENMHTEYQHPRFFDALKTFLQSLFTIIKNKLKEAFA